MVFIKAGFLHIVHLFLFFSSVRIPGEVLYPFFFSMAHVSHGCQWNS